MILLFLRCDISIFRSKSEKLQSSSKLFNFGQSEILGAQDSVVRSPRKRLGELGLPASRRVTAGAHARLSVTH